MGGADSPRTMRTDCGMLRTGHAAADFTFRHMMYTEQFIANLAAKAAFLTHLPSAESTTMGLRLSDMLITAGTGDGAVQADMRMTQIACANMNIAHNSVTFRALFPTVWADMPATFATSEQMLRTETPVAEMTFFTTGRTAPFAAFSAGVVPALRADQRSAAMTFMQTVATHRLSAVFADPKLPHVTLAGCADRIERASGKKVVKTVYRDMCPFGFSAVGAKYVTTTAERNAHSAEADRLDRDLYVAFSQFFCGFLFVFLLQLLCLGLTISRRLRKFLDHLSVKTFQAHHILMIPGCQFLLVFEGLLPGMFFDKFETTLVNGF